MDGLAFKNNQIEISIDYPSRPQDAMPFNVEFNDHMTIEAPTRVRRQENRSP